MIRANLLALTLVMTLVTNMGLAGDIRHFTDNKGILHISNVERAVRLDPEKYQGPGMTETLSGKLPIIPTAFESAPRAEQPGTVLVTAKDASTESELREQERSVEDLFQQVYRAAEVLNMGIAGAAKSLQFPEISNLPRLAHPASNGSISSCKDTQGVIHITSRPGGEAQSTNQAAAGSVPQEQTVLPDASQPTFRQIAWPMPQMAVAASHSSISPVPLADPHSNTIRRYRDRNGVWRITNNPPPVISPAIPIVPMVQIARAPEIMSGSPPLDLNPLSAMAMDNEPLSGAGSPTIIARRDKRGISHIYNLAATGLVHDRGSPGSLLGKLPPALQPIIVEAALTYQLPVSLILALIRNESNFAPQAISPKGAMGLMQLMPGTAAFLGVQNPFSPRENILAGCRYFRLLLNQFQGSVPLALAAYNAGSQRVISAGYQVPTIKETQGFVTQVMALYYLLEKRSALRL